MGRKSFTVELINQFVIDNFTPHAWCKDWEISNPDFRGLYYFRMVALPNDYDRHAFNPSPYDIEIPLIKGDAITKNNLDLDTDARVKHTYCNQLSNNVIAGLDKLFSSISIQIHSSKEVFGDDKKIVPSGDRWSKLRSYENQDHRSEWSFV